MQSMDRETILEIQKLSKRAGKELLLDNICLKVGAAERVALIGPKEAGKTCLLDVVLGLSGMQSGEVIFQGEMLRNNILGGSPLREEIAYVPSIPPLFGGNLTPEGLFRMTERKKRKSFRKDYEFLCEQFDIPLEKPLRTMTYRQNRLVSFIHGIMQNPVLLLVDDMENYLDGANMELIFSMLGRRKTAVLYTERELEETCVYCDRAYFMEEGCIKGEYEPRELWRKSVLTLPEQDGWITKFLRGEKLCTKGEQMFFLYEGSRTFLFEVCRYAGVSSIWLEPLSIDEQVLEDYERWQI